MPKSSEDRAATNFLHRWYDIIVILQGHWNYPTILRQGLMCLFRGQNYADHWPHLPIHMWHCVFKTLKARASVYKNKNKYFNTVDVGFKSQIKTKHSCCHAWIATLVGFLGGYRHSLDMGLLPRQSVHHQRTWVCFSFVLTTSCMHKLSPFLTWGCCT